MGVAEEIIRLGLEFVGFIHQLICSIGGSLQCVDASSSRLMVLKESSSSEVMINNVTLIVCYQ